MRQPPAFACPGRSRAPDRSIRSDATCPSRACQAGGAARTWLPAVQARPGCRRRSRDPMTATTCPQPSAKAWIFVAGPPRERPMPRTFVPLPAMCERCARAALGSVLGSRGISARLTGPSIIFRHGRIPPASELKRLWTVMDGPHATRGDLSAAVRLRNMDDPADNPSVVIPARAGSIVRQRRFDRRCASSESRYPCVIIRLRRDLSGVNSGVNPV